MTGYLKRLSVLLITITIATVSLGQVTNDSLKKIDPELFKTDFVIFRDSLQQIHPALYRYRDKNEMNRLFDSSYATINKDMTEMQFYMLLRFLTSSIEDGHTACNLPRELILNQFNNAKVFPLRLWFIDKKTFIYCSTDEQFQAGSELISIDNKPVNEIRKLLFQYLVSDGQIQSKKYWTFNGSEPNFQFMYYWIWGKKPKFSVEYKTQTGNIKTLMVNAAILKNNDCFSDKKTTDKYLSLDFKPNIAILTIKTFDMNRLNEEDTFLKNFLDSAFKEIKAKKIKNLIIDVRDNGGGEDANGSLLYSYLTDKPFSYYSSLETISSKYPKEAHPNLEIQQPNKDNFKGKCYFLINGKSFSTTSEFCAIAKSNNRGKFIGEETGGGYYGNTGGEMERVVLPSTKIVIVIPRRKYVLAVKKAENKDRGIIPDDTIIPTINDILQNKDVQLNYVLKLAKEE